MPQGQKKVPKVYQIACHPLQPHLVAVAANAGKQHFVFALHCPWALTYCGVHEESMKGLFLEVYEIACPPLSLSFMAVGADAGKHHH